MLPQTPSGLSLPGIVACRVIQTVPQSIPNTITTSLNFTEALFDTHQCWKPANPERLYAPRSGWYMGGGATGLSSAQNTVASRLIMTIDLRYAGSNRDDLLAQNSIFTIANLGAALQVASGITYMREGDWLEIGFNQNEGAAKLTNPGDGAVTQYTHGWLIGFPFDTYAPAPPTA